MAHDDCGCVMCTATDPIDKALWELLDDAGTTKHMDVDDLASYVKTTADQIRRTMPHWETVVTSSNPYVNVAPHRVQPWFTPSDTHIKAGLSDG